MTNEDYNMMYSLFLLMNVATAFKGSFNGFSSMPGGFGWANTKGLVDTFGNEDFMEKYPNAPAYIREAEIKHGRVAMLAAVGFPVSELWHPLFGGDIDVPSYISFQATPLQTFWPIVLGAIGLIESTSSLTKFESPLVSSFTLKKNHKSGDLGFDPLCLKPNNPRKLRKYVEAELNVGRVAMLGIASMVGEELITHSTLF